MTINVLLVDDHTVFVETLAASLRTNPDITVVGVATTATEGRAKAAELRPDVALVDLSMPDFDGIELSRQLRSASPSTKVVILTGNTEPSPFPQAMAAGAFGYLIKDSSLGEVTEAIRRAHAGQVVVPDRVVELVEARAPAKGLGSALTKRELEVLVLLGEGNDVRHIAKTLGVTWSTVRSYVKSVLLKLHAHTQLEAVAKATRLGILSVREGESR